MIHPLRQAYIDTVYKEFGCRLAGDDKAPLRTISIADKVEARDLSYEEFIGVAIDMWKDYAEKLGHKYPYWSMITGNVTFERLDALIVLVGDLSGGYDRQRFYMMEAELAFASSYIDHRVNGNGSAPPTRVIQVSAEIRCDVAESLCLMLGVPFHGDNLDYIARQYCKICEK